MDDQGPVSRFFSSLTSTPGRIAATLGGAALIFAAITPLVFKDWSPISKIPMNWSKDEERTVDLPAGAFSRRGQASGESLKMLKGEGLFAPKPGAPSAAAAAGASQAEAPPPGHAEPGAPAPDGDLPPDPPTGLKPGLSNTSSGGRGGGGFAGSGGGATPGLGRSDAGTAKTGDAWRGTDEHYVTQDKRKGSAAKGGKDAPGGVGGTSAANAAQGAPGELDGISAAETGGLMGIAPPAPKTKSFGGSADTGGGGGAAGGGASSEGGDAGDSTGDSAKCVAARKKWGPILSFYESEAIKFERQFAQNCGGSYSRSTCGNPWLHYCNYTTGIWAAVYQRYCSCARLRCKANGAKKNMDNARCGIAAGCPSEPC